MQIMLYLGKFNFERLLSLKYKGVIEMKLKKITAILIAVILVISAVPMGVSAKAGVTSNTYFDKLSAYISQYGKTDSKGYKTLISTETSSTHTSYLVLQNKNGGIYFEILMAKRQSTGITTDMGFTLHKNNKNISVEFTMVYYEYNKAIDAITDNIGIDRSTYSPSKKYTSYKRGVYFTSSQFSELFNGSLEALCACWDSTIYKVLGFGLEELGFLSYPGYGSPVCDIASGYHTGGTEIRNKKSATCTTDGYTGDTYCTDCGEKRKSGSTIYSTGHKYDNSCDETCNICGAVREVTHTYTNSCDETCNNCGAVRVAPHTYSGMCDEECNLCGRTRKTSTPHTYSNDCDTTCDVCGAVREVKHQFSNSCDTTCNLCGFTREIQHTYSSDCDAFCNVCSYMRTTTVPHTFSNDCDTTCNLCGAVRKVNHTFTSDCDETCDICGFVRETSAAHTYSSDCDAVCDVCGCVRKTTVEHKYNDENICELCGARKQVGDINNDGVVDSGDAIEVLRHNAKIITLSGAQFILADVNGDDKVDANDAILILKYNAKTIDKFPVEK